MIRLYNSRLDANSPNTHLMKGVHAMTGTFTTVDREGKDSQMQIGTNPAADPADFIELASALDAVILGSATKAVETTSTVHQQGSQAPSSAAFAQAGNKWLFRVQDDVTGQIYTHEYGTADNGVLSSTTDDFLDLTAGVGLTLKTEFEALYRSPDGNAGTLLSVQQVNRKR